MVRVLLKFSEKVVEQPITSQVILKYGIPINIISAHIDSQGGEILAEIPSTSFNEIVQGFLKKGVVVETPELLKIDNERCINCGACISLCPMSVMTFAEDFAVTFNEEKCIGKTCGVCVEACPVRVIKLIEGRSHPSSLSSK